MAPCTSPANADSPAAAQPVATPGPRRRLPDLPGPPGIPIFGNLLQLKRGSAHQTLEQWARQYGAPFRFRAGSRTFLVVTDHEVTAAMLRERPDTFRRSSRLARVMEEAGLEPGVFIASGEAWKRQRRMVMAAFDPAHVKAYFPSLMEVASRLRRRWMNCAAQGQAIDLLADLTRYTVDGVAGLAFGAKVNTIDGREDVIQQHLDRIFPALFRRTMAPFSYWRYVKVGPDRQLPGHVRAIKHAVRGFIADARARMVANPQLSEHPTNLLEAMLAAAAREEGAVNDSDIAGNVFTMLQAGEDTTANTLAWLIWLLKRNPTALERCIGEMKDIAADLSSVNMERLAQLAYLDACINEAMRLKPVAPYFINEAMHDTVVGDVEIEARTVVWSINRFDSVNEKYFENAHAFEPERWLAGAMHGNDSAKRVMMPFGGGPRICPGRYLALLEIKLAMVMLLTNFEIADVWTPDGKEPREFLTIVMAPVGLRMLLRVKG